MDELERQIAEASVPRRRRPGEASADDNVVVAKPEMVEILIDLPPQAADIRVDGRVFQHNGRYKVREDQAISLQEIMYRAWSHYREVKGEKLPLEALRGQRQSIIRG